MEHNQNVDFYTNSWNYSYAPNMCTNSADTDGNMVQQSYQDYNGSAMSYYYDSEDSSATSTQQDFSACNILVTNCLTQSQQMTTSTVPTSGHQQADEKPEKQLTTKWQRKRAYEMTLPVHIRQKRRIAANARERKRMTGLNEAFERLRDILPCHRDR